MVAQEVFLSCMGVLAIFNFIVCGGETWNINGFIGLLIAVIPVVIFTGIQLLSSGFSSSSQNKAFGIVVLLSILCKIDLPSSIDRTSNITGLTRIGRERFIENIGLGLGTDTIAMFPAEEFFGIPFFIATSIVILAFVSGLIMILESG